MDIKTTMRYHSLLKYLTNKTEDTKCYWGCRANRALIYWWWECKLVQPLWKRVWQFPIKLNTLTTRPVVLLLDIHPISLKTQVQRKTWMWMFIEDLFIAPSWKQLRFPSVGEWVNKWWYAHSMEYYSAIRRNGLLINSTEEFEMHFSKWVKPYSKAT